MILVHTTALFDYIELLKSTKMLALRMYKIMAIYEIVNSMGKLSIKFSDFNIVTRHHKTVLQKDISWLFLFKIYDNSLSKLVGTKR